MSDPMAAALNAAALIEHAGDEGALAVLTPDTLGEVLAVLRSVVWFGAALAAQFAAAINVDRAEILNTLEQSIRTTLNKDDTC